MVNKGLLTGYLTGIASFIKEQATNAIQDGTGIDVALAAFNEMQDDERDGADYIFDINNEDDLAYLAGRKLITAKEIAFIVNSPDRYRGGYFTIHYEDGIQPVEDIQKTLIGWLDELIPFVMLYVARGKDTAYQAFYEKFFVDKVYELDFFNPL